MKRICMALLAAAILTAGCSASPPPTAPAPPAAPVASAAPEMFRGVPVPPGAQLAKGVWADRQIYRLEGTTWEQVRDWYFDQMPNYGWGMAKCAGGPAEGESYRSTFGGNDGRTATIALVTQTRYTELRIITADPQGGAKCGG